MHFIILYPTAAAAVYSAKTAPCVVSCIVISMFVTGWCGRGTDNYHHQDIVMRESGTKNLLQGFYWVFNLIGRKSNEFSPRHDPSKPWISRARILNWGEQSTSSGSFTSCLALNLCLPSSGCRGGGSSLQTSLGRLQFTSQLLCLVATFGSCFAI